ncbi:DUF6515 family protein [Mucilaginibacter sp.]|uniref:DUF6515 family protein n=1 Tax=Mucilaginibacter sp. TaxID=1882438 RepID=UPI002627F92D|nr:DUF6515 family protein [Mucilaginibacter sp.]MDB5127272.1 hypothetical protein [Mucilaginibacter sp.]
MTTISKCIAGLFIAGSLVLGLTAPAAAQRDVHSTTFNRTAFHMRPDALKGHAGGFYHPYVYPRAGVVVRTLPSGYYSFVWKTYPYYYSDGLFYQSYADRSYKVAAPLVGTKVPSLPLGADIITIGYSSRRLVCL